MPIRHGYFLLITGNYEVLELKEKHLRKAYLPEADQGTCAFVQVNV